MLAIKHLADRAAEVVFVDFGTFMLERTVRSLVDLDEPEFVAKVQPRRPLTVPLCGSVSK